MAQINSKVAGCLFGLAYGDALGADTEFMDVAHILKRYPPAGPQELVGHPARVTDDTQMTLAVGKALLQAERPYRPGTLEEPLRTAFIEWSRSPENNRAPGMTCLRACEQLAVGVPWYKATVASSKGCGANMRVAPVGLLSDSVADAHMRSALAQFQAALTHGHPTALAASDLTAAAIHDLLLGGDPAGLVSRLREYALSQRTFYYADWLGFLWERPGYTTAEQFIVSGWDECLAVLDRLEKAVEVADREQDPCLATGDGWIAEEAFATGLLCFLLFPDDPVAAVRRGALTRGDSDSIACLTGAFAGAYLGLECWPPAWRELIEYCEQIQQLADQLEALT